MRRLTRPRLAVLLAVIAAFALGATLTAAFGASKAEPTTTRYALAQTERVQGAPQRTLVLSKVVVDPGAKLPLHHHLGTQVARIVSGSLNYTVRKGTVVVRRGQSDQNPRVVRKIEAGQTARLRPGEWLVEQPSAIHEAANRGSAPVVIFLATLLKTGAPPATPVTLSSRPR